MLKRAVLQKKHKRIAGGQFVHTMYNVKWTQQQVTHTQKNYLFMQSRQTKGGKRSFGHTHSKISIAHTAYKNEINKIKKKRGIKNVSFSRFTWLQDTAISHAVPWKGFTCRESSWERGCVCVCSGRFGSMMTDCVYVVFNAFCPA